MKSLKRGEIFSLEFPHHFKTETIISEYFIHTLISKNLTKLGFNNDTLYKSSAVRSDLPVL